MPRTVNVVDWSTNAPAVGQQPFLVARAPLNRSPGILVLDGEQRAGLAVTRSLVRAGYRVHVAVRSRWSLAARSRGAHAESLTADPLADPVAFVREIGRLATSVGCSVIVPVTDASMEAVLEHRDLLPADAILPCAPLATYRTASDKLRVHDAAGTTGLAVRETYVVRSPRDDAPSDPSLYPGVVKPHRSVVTGEAGRVKLNVRTVADRDSCRAALRSLPPEAFPVLVQRRVRGDGIGVFVGRWGGRTFARFAHRRLREKPPAGGVSVLSESIALPPELERACEALLDRLDWTGVAMVECKEDRDAGGWRVIEINGRFWGSLQLAIDAGVDFPALLVGAALGAPRTSPPAWRVGGRLRWEWGAVDHLFLRLRYSSAQLDLPTTAPGRLAALAAFLAHRPGRDRFEVLRWNDPLPFVAESLAWLRIVP